VNHPSEVLYRIHKALKLTPKEIVDILQTQAYQSDVARIESHLVRQKERSFVPCDYELLGLFLDGLIEHFRGKSDRPQSDEPLLLDNNLILKKLSIALKLKRDAIEMIFNLADIFPTKQELNALFRAQGHKNYKGCSNELLILFLKGLEEYYFSGGLDEIAQH